MNQIVIIPDLHHRQDIANQILELEPEYTNAIFLGDTFDQFNDTTEDVKNAAIWLKESLNNPKHIHCVGNHDHSYRFPGNPNAWCSGFTHDKCRTIRSVLNNDDFAKLKLYHRENNILFSHAGVSRRYLNFLVDRGLIQKRTWSIDNVCAILNNLESKANQKYALGGEHELYMVGMSRGGELEVGSPIWCDQREFFPTEFIQVYGHTPRPHPEFKLVKSGTFTETYVYAHEEVPDLNDYHYSICLDDHTSSYAVLNQDWLNIYKLKFDKPWTEKNRQIIDRNLIFSRKI